MTVAILGCGPAGLLAAHAVVQAGESVAIYATKRQRSDMPGAIFIHEPIPGLTSEEPDAHIKFEKLGRREDYAYKVYGSRSAPCSWAEFPVGIRDGWNLKKLYNELWLRFGLEVREQQVDSDIMEDICLSYKTVISTIPPQAYCCDPGHNFDWSRIWVQREHRDICEQLGDPCVIYNGQPEFDYYRTSLLFGEGSTEYGHEVPGAEPGVKPTATDCNCFTEAWRAGRFGLWRKGVLAHDAYYTAKEALGEM